MDKFDGEDSILAAYREHVIEYATQEEKASMDLVNRPALMQLE